MTRSGSLYGPVGPINPRTGKVMSPTYNQADKVNKEGAPAFSRTVEEETLAVLTTQTLSNTFYASQKEMAKETIEVLRRMSAKDPAFLAKALIHARNNGLMKLAPTVGLAVLSENKTEEGREAFRKAFRHVIRIPDDLREFVELIRTGSFGGKKAIMGARKVAIQHWLRHMSEYHAVKYGSSKSQGITLRDILRLTHPLPKVLDQHKDGKGPSYDRLRSGAQAELFGWIVKGWEGVGKEPSPTNPMVWATEMLKRAEDEKESIALIKKYKLPREVVEPSAKKMTTEVWAALAEGMPYMALLRNLNTLERHKVLEDKAVVKRIAERLSDEGNVAHSKQLPFRFFNAFNAFTGPQAIKDALGKAMEASFVNLPGFEGDACIFNDISSSMNSSVSEKSHTSLSQIAAIFAAATYKKSQDDVFLLPFDTEVSPELTAKITRQDSIMSIVSKIGLTRGGTDLGAPIKYLLSKKKKVDVLIGFTDNEDWAGHGFLTDFEEYKSRINPKAKAFLVTLAPNRDFVAPTGYQDVFFIFGWSESILRYVPLMLAGGKDQVSDVHSINLDTYGTKPKEEEVEATASAD